MPKIDIEPRQFDDIEIFRKYSTPIVMYACHLVLMHVWQLMFPHNYYNLLHSMVSLNGHKGTIWILVYEDINYEIL